MIPLIRGMQISQIHRNTKYNTKDVKEGMGNCYIMGTEFQFSKMKKFR